MVQSHLTRYTDGGIDFFARNAVMKSVNIFCALVLVASAPACPAEQFQLKEIDSETLLGPFEYKANQTLKILDYEFEILPVENQTAKTEALLRNTKIQMSLLSGPIEDVIANLAKTINAELGAENAVNFVQCWIQDDQKAQKPDKSSENLLPAFGNDDESVEPYPPRGTTLGVNLKHISALEAVKAVAEAAGLQFRIDGTTVLIHDGNLPGAKLVTRTYPVQPSILDVVVEREEEEARNDEFAEMGGSRSRIPKASIQDFFEKAGVPFPKGSWVEYNAGLSQLVVKNTLANHTIFERIMNQPCCIPSQVQIDFRLFECADRATGENLRKHHSDFLERQYVEDRKIRLVYQDGVVTRSGVNAQTKNETKLYHEDTLKDSDGEDGKEIHSLLDLGYVINVTPFVAPDGQTIDLTLIWESRDFSNWMKVQNETGLRTLPSVSQRETRTSVVLLDGESLVLSISDIPPTFEPKLASMESERPLLLILSARLIDTDGEPIHRPETTK